MPPVSGLASFKNLFLTPFPQSGRMDPAAIASGMISARMGQAQLALAARLMQKQQIADVTMVTKLLAAAEANMKQMATAVQAGIGETVDIMA